MTDTTTIAVDQAQRMTSSDAGRERLSFTRSSSQPWNFRISSIGNLLPFLSILGGCLVFI
ncbi:MAG: hypothetical protein QM690_07885 [Sphingobium sp.]